MSSRSQQALLRRGKPASNGQGGSSGGGTPPAGDPTLTGIDPTLAKVGASTFTLTCTGTNFSATSKIWYNAVQQTTTFGGATTLTCSIPSAGETAGTRTVQVKDGAKTTATMTFTWEPVAVSFFNEGTTTGSNSTDTSSNSLGIRIDPIVDGTLESISWFRPDAAAQTYGWVGVWDLVNVELLVGVEWYGVTGTGWKKVILPKKPQLLSTRCYCACVWLRPNASNQIIYKAQSASWPVTGLTIAGQVALPPSNGTTVRGYPQRNGMYIANGPNNFFLMPNDAFNSGNYWVDIGWLPGAYPAVPLGGYPNAANTGHTGTLTTLAGDQNITVAGTTLLNRDITGKLYINANNVTVRNCRISAGAGMIGADGVVVVGDSVTGTLIEDCTIFGQNTSDGIKGIWGSGTFRRNDISGSEDGVYMRGGTLIFEDNYIHDLKATGNVSPHTDGFSIDTASVNSICRHNTIRLNDGTGYLGGTACVNITNYGGNVTNTLIEDNICEGGGNQILLDGRFTNTPGSIISGTTVKNNIHYGFGFAALADVQSTGTVPSGTTQIKPPPAGYFD